MNTRIKEVREDRDIKQQDIAQLLETTPQQYGRYENGHRELPIRHLRTLAIYYNISADYLLGIIDDPRPIK